MEEEDGSCGAYASAEYGRYVDYTNWLVGWFADLVNVQLLQIPMTAGLT